MTGGVFNTRGLSARRLILEWTILLLCGCALAAYLVAGEQTYRFDGRMLDLATSLARGEPDDSVVIVAIDEESLSRIGAWPWPRETHAELVGRLDNAGARQILYDVLFIEPTSQDADTRLAEAMAASGKVILPHTFVPQPNAASGAVPEFPLPRLVAAAQGIGHVGANPDDDGVLRRFEPVIESSGRSFPHMVYTALQQGEGEQFQWRGPVEEAPIVPFFSPGSIPRVSAAAVIAGEVPAGFLRDRTVLVGATAQGMGDRYSVPSEGVGTMPGVETQANFLIAARDGNLVRDAGKIWQAILAFGVLLLLFAAFWRLDPKRGLVATIVLLAGTFALTVLLVPLAGIWVAPGSTVLVLLLAYPLWNWRRLTAVSNYLDREAERLAPEAGKPGTGTGFDVVARQVDRMRNLVRTVSDSFDFMRRVIELAPDAILVLDRKGGLQMMNQRAEQLFPGWATATDNPVLEEMLLYVGATIDREKGELETATGETFLLARASFDMAGEGGEGEIVALRDISQIRRRENERKQMLEFLSHDMRSPQVAIIGLAGRDRECDTGDDRFTRIRAQAERTLKLADDFVQIARLEEARPQLEDTELVALVEEAVDRQYSLARKAEMTIEQVLPEDPVFAWVDASLIARLLDNLLGNAIKYGPAGSRVSIQLAEEDGRIEIDITDEGPGLPPERLVDPFARFGAHETKAGPSAGLGLTFVKRAVELHNGTISVDSGPGVGTRFVIRIPQDHGPVESD